MSIADKLTTIAGNVQKVYEAGQAASSGTGGGTCKEEQEKAITITENGVTEVLPDENKVLSKVTVAVDVPIDDCYDEGYTAGHIAGYEEGKTDGLVEGGALFKALAEGTIEEINDDTITMVKNYAFANCDSLKMVALNSLDIANGNLASGWLSNCTTLETVNLPKTKTFGYSGLSGCKALKNVYAPNASTSYNCLSNCSSLEFLDLPKMHYVNAYSFSGCTSLKTLIIRVTQTATTGNVAYLNNINAFANTPFRNGEGGTIYVPQALVENYKTATNWNALESTTFLPIEGSEYE